METRRIPTSQLFGTSPLNKSLIGGDFPPISPRLQAVLQQIVSDVVARLGCVGAMVTTLEQGNALPVRAYSLRFAESLLRRLERQAGATLIGPQAVVYLDDERFQQNISYRSVTGRNGRLDKFVISDSLGDLLCPIVGLEFADMAQKMTGIHHIIALPFFIEDQVVGNLLAATRDAFSQRDIDFLTAFGQQAAYAIQSQRRLDEMRALERVVLDLQSQIGDETRMLQTIVNAVVQKLGFFGALVRTLEPDGELHLRAWSFDFPEHNRPRMEQQLTHHILWPVRVIPLHDDEFHHNLVCGALLAGPAAENRYRESGRLWDLVRPLIDEELAAAFQLTFRVRSVIAVPFYLGDDAIGSLSVLSHSPYFSEHEKAMLTAFAQQAAMGIRNARLYNRAEEQRQIAQTLARMAFSASAYVHTLRNHVGAFGNYLMLAQHLADLPPEQQHELAEIQESVADLIQQTLGILDNLHEPWRQKPDEPADLNVALYDAIHKLFPQLQLEPGRTLVDSQVGVALHFDLEAQLPTVQTAPEMLVEVFSILVSNALDAIADTGHEGHIWLSSRQVSDQYLEVLVRDNGTGIRPENLGHIFEMGWTTREDGMGFGLFWMKDYIEGLGGSIAVESTVGQGATFFVRLPLQQGIARPLDTGTLLRRQVPARRTGDLSA